MKTITYSDLKLSHRGIERTLAIKTTIPVTELPAGKIVLEVHTKYDPSKGYFTMLRRGYKTKDHVQIEKEADITLDSTITATNLRIEHLEKAHSEFMQILNTEFWKEWADSINIPIEQFLENAHLSPLG